MIVLLMPTGMVSWFPTKLHKELLKGYWGFPASLTWS